MRYWIIWTQLVVDIPNDIAIEMKRFRFINWNEKLVKDILFFMKRTGNSGIYTRKKANLKKKILKKSILWSSVIYLKKYYKTEIGAWYQYYNLSTFK